MATATAFESYTDRLSTDEKYVIAYYQGLNSYAQKMWQSIYDRTLYKEWEDNEEGLGGVGSCAADRATIELGISLKHLIHLRDIRNRSTPGSPADLSSEGYEVCGYHREGKGCCLGDLKSPICEIYLPDKLHEELDRRFGYKISDDISHTLMMLSQALVNLQSPTLPWSEKRRWIKAAMTGIDRVITRLQRFPVLTNR